MSRMRKTRNVCSNCLWEILYALSFCWKLHEPPKLVFIETCFMIKRKTTDEQL